MDSRKSRERCVWSNEGRRYVERRLWGVFGEEEGYSGKETDKEKQ